jgi:hypothetical protein
MRATLYQSLTRAAPHQDKRAMAPPLQTATQWKPVALISRKQFTAPAKRRMGNGVIRRKKTCDGDRGVRQVILRAAVKQLCSGATNARNTIYRAELRSANHNNRSRSLPPQPLAASSPREKLSDHQINGGKLCGIKQNFSC